MLLSQLPLYALLAAQSSSEGPFAFEFSDQTTKDGRAELVLIANQDLEPFQLTLDGDNQQIEKKIPGLKSGQRYKVTWTQNTDYAVYSALFTTPKLDSTFQFAVRRGNLKQNGTNKLEIVSSRDELVNHRRAAFRTSFTLSSYTYKIYDIRGNVLVDGVVRDQTIPAGDIVTITWNVPGDVFLIHVRGEDETSRYAEFKVVPWSVDIPHTEVHFESGKADILSDEAVKIDEALSVAFNELDALDKVNEAVNAGIEPQLYIVGYTDTVGPTSKNQILSEARAKAIAEYFRDRGFWAAIYFAGMGEKGLRVSTPDNTDEIRNRRAVYILSVQPPAGSQIPTHWQKLVNARSRPDNFQLPPVPEKWAKKNQTPSTPTTLNPNPSSPDPSEPASPSTTDQGPPPPAQQSPSADPPPAAGKPGVTARGCNLSPVPPPLSLGFTILAALACRRRQRALLYTH